MRRAGRHCYTRRRCGTVRASRPGGYDLRRTRKERDARPYGYTLMTEQSGPRELVGYAARRGAGRLRLRGDERPLLPLARRAGARGVRLEHARRGLPGHRAGRADDLRDLPDHALPPGRGRPEGRDRRAAQRRAVHARASARGRTSTSTWSAGAGRRSTSGTRCSARRSRSSPRCSTAATSTSPATTSGSTPRSCGTCPSSGCRSAVAVSGEQSIETFAPLVDHLIAVEPERRPGADLGRGGRRAGRAARSASCRSAGTPTATVRSTRAHEQFRWFGGGWKVNAELPGPAGLRRRHPVRATRGRRRLDPVRPGRRARSWRRSARSRRPGSPTSRWCRSATRSRRSSSSFAERELLPALARRLTRSGSLARGNVPVARRSATDDRGPRPQHDDGRARAPAGSPGPTARGSPAPTGARPDAAACAATAGSPASRCRSVPTRRRARPARPSPRWRPAAPTSGTSSRVAGRLLTTLASTVATTAMVSSASQPRPVRHERAHHVAQEAVAQARHDDAEAQHEHRERQVGGVRQRAGVDPPAGQGVAAEHDRGGSRDPRRARPRAARGPRTRPASARPAPAVRRAGRRPASVPRRPAGAPGRAAKYSR